MKLKPTEGTETYVPSALLLGLSPEDKEALSAHYRNSITLLKEIKEHIEQDIETLVESSESIHPAEHMNYVRNAAERHALRNVLKNYFPRS